MRMTGTTRRRVMRRKRTFQSHSTRSFRRFSAVASNT
jgi:hypothetical protein